MTSVRSLAERSARQAADAYGRVTTSQRALPTFLIVGGQRCGTTTLFKALTEHPGVLPPTLRKGVHYFDIAYDRDLHWYRRHFPTRWAVARASRQVGAPAQVGESSPYYLWHPAAPSRIAAALPDVRVIAVLRDPVERAYSAWSHERARGYESEDFAQALALEPERLAGQEEKLLDPGSRNPRSFAHQHQAYLQRGVYVDQLERMADAVGRDHMLVLDSVDLWSAPADHWPQVLEFLGLPDAPVALEQHNARTRSPMDDTLRCRLAEHFAAADARLADWWGHTPSWRR
jgi:hypothetical protein